MFSDYESAAMRQERQTWRKLIKKKIPRMTAQHQEIWTTIRTPSMVYLYG